MTRPPTDPEALIAALAEQARSDASGTPEPEPEELLDYLAGRLAPEDEERIARRLAADPAAARALLDLAELDAAGAEAGVRPTEIAAVASWRDLRDRLPDAAPQPRRLPPVLSAIAASLLLATLGLGSWGWRLEKKLHSPVANLPSLELPSGGRAGGERIVVLAPGAPLRLVLSPAERCPSYTAEVEGPRSRDRQTIEGLERDELGRLTVLLRLEPGSYGLRLLGCEPRQVLEEHGFRVTRGDG
ncbi:MAG TPA: hypothetical protein VKM72_21380 [Thermoanaerobaculia bacterium]|nr:hypothetical protein [Thermoanaerobaculia bacterium]